jgi:CubicO group peptidase (beta-lactamase class C family)
MQSNKTKSISWHFTLLLTILAVLTTTSAVPAAALAANGPENPAEFEAFMDGLMSASMQANHIPGAVIVLVMNGEVFFAKGYGRADLESRIPVDPARNLFRPGSVSKLFTWTAVMQLVEQGQLDLDVDINTYLDFTIPATFPQPITLKHLLTHTPGFEDWGNDLFKLNPDEMISLEAYVKNNQPQRIFPPGKIGAYSNYGTAVAGYIVQRVSGMPFEEYIEKNIFAPLGMTQASFRQPLPSQIAGDMASGYNYINGGYIKGGFEYVVGYPAGSLSASGLDMAKFMIAHLQNGRYGTETILQESTARQMHSQAFTHDPRLPGMAYGFFEDVINNQRIISHGGDTFLFHSGLFLIPEQNLGLFISTNGASGAKLVEAVAMNFMKRYFPAEMPKLTPDPGFPERANLYAGEYYLARSNDSTFEKFIRLTMTFNISVDAENNVIIPLTGEAVQYIETEPGLLVNRENPDDKLVMREEDGQVYIYPSMPFVLIKTPWHGALSLHLLILLGGAILFLATLVGWGISFGRGLRQKEPRPFLARLARVTGALFGLGWLLFVMTMGTIFSDIDPAYGVPKVFFGDSQLVNMLEGLSPLLLVLGVAMLAFTIVAWWKRLWTLGGRVFYTFSSLWALAILWSLHYWNLLL